MHQRLLVCEQAFLCGGAPVGLLSNYGSLKASLSTSLFLDMNSMLQNIKHAIALVIFLICLLLIRILVSSSLVGRCFHFAAAGLPAAHNTRQWKQERDEHDDGEAIVQELAKTTRQEVDVSQGKLPEAQHNVVSTSWLEQP